MKRVFLLFIAALVLFLAISAPASAAEAAPSPTPTAAVGTDYVLNTNTKKIHRPGCKSVKDIKDKNREDVHGDLDDFINDGYVPCKKCKPN